MYYKKWTEYIYTLWLEDKVMGLHRKYSAVCRVKSM